MKKAWLMLLSAVCGAMALPASAAEYSCFDQNMTVFQWGAFAPAQLFSERTEVKGLRLSTVYSENQHMTGLDVGVVAGAVQATGLQVTVANTVDQKFTGAQVALLNYNAKETSGVQIGGANFAGSDDSAIPGSASAAQVGYVNVSNSSFWGGQVGMVNLSNWKFSGFQFGFINCNDDSEAPEKAKCYQFGVINYNTSGFLLFCPFFNY